MELGPGVSTQRRRLATLGDSLKGPPGQRILNPRSFSSRLALIHKSRTSLHQLNLGAFLSSFARKMLESRLETSPASNRWIGSTRIHLERRVPLMSDTSRAAKSPLKPACCKANHASSCSMSLMRLSMKFSFKHEMPFRNASQLPGGQPFSGPFPPASGAASSYKGLSEKLM